MPNALSYVHGASSVTGREAHRRHREGSGRGRHDDGRNRIEVAISQGSVGMCGRRSGRREPLGLRAGSCAVRSAGDLPHLVARPSSGDQGRDDVRAGDPAREALPVGRAHLRDADRSQGRRRDRVELPGRANHCCGPDAGILGVREASRPITRAERGEAVSSRRAARREAIGCP